MKDISKVRAINTHIQRLGHQGSYRLDDTLRLFNSSVGCGEWKRTPAIRPDAEIRCLRTLVRYRAELVERRAPHINHMIQALKHMNIQLNLVLTDITGVSGLAMLRAIIAGEREPGRLAIFRQPGWKHSEAEIVKALTGTWDDT